MPNKKDDLVVTLLNEVREDQKVHSTILIELQQDVATNTKDLTEHKEGVIQNRKRIEVLEEPGKVFGVVKKYLLGAGAIAGSVYGIYRLVNLL